MAKAGRLAAASRAAVGLVLAGGLAVSTPALASGAYAEAFWTDSQTGFAIGGYDPVAYFVNHAPRPGAGDHQLNLDGYDWLFSSAANQAVFERDPGVYAPRFGGFDPLQLSRGYAMRGNPLYWLIEEGRLYLFGSPVNRLGWMELRAGEKVKAQENWPTVVPEID